MIVFNNKLLNEKNLKESCVKSENARIADYSMDKKSDVGVQSIDNKKIASGYPIPEYPSSVCDEVNKKIENLQPVNCAVNSGTSLKSASSGHQKHSFNSLVQSGNPVLKHSIEDLIKNGKEGDQFLNKKRLKKSKNNFIDDEAEDDDEIVDDEEENDIDKDEYDLNDSFINDEEEKNTEEINYNKINNELIEKDSFFKEENENKYIVLKEKDFLEYFDVRNCLNFNKDLQNDLNNFLVNYIKEKNINYQFKTKIKVFDKFYIFWYQFLSFTSFIFKINNNIEFEIWDDLDIHEVGSSIIEFILILLEKKLERNGILLNFLNFYIFQKNFDNDLLVLYNNIQRLFPSLPNPEFVFFNIVQNPGQNIVKFYKVNLLNYIKYEKEFADFYKDKAKDYDLKLNKLEEEDKQKLIEKNIKNKEYLENAREQLKVIENGYFYNDNFDNDFEIVDNKEKLFKVNYTLNTKSFGFVIYMDKLNYNLEKLECNKEIHMPHYLPVLCKAVLFYLKRFIPNKHLLNIIIAHEHGEKNFKCHIQGFLEFSDRINLKICPGSFKVKYFLENNIENQDKEKEQLQNYLIMFQSAKNKFALQNYVKKKDALVPYNKFMEYQFDNKTVSEAFEKFENIEFHDENDKDKDKSDNNELYNMLLNLPGLDYNTLKEICLNNDSTSAKKFIIQNFEKIIKVNQLCNSNVEVPSFKWTFPEYAIQYIDNYKKDMPGFLDNDLYTFFHETYNWFNNFCLNNDPNFFDNKNSNRKLGLLVYGDRGIGKTTFFQNFCGDFPNPKDNPFIIYCRNTIAWEDFEKKLDTVQLIILDDITFIKNQKEVLKGLIVGQPVTMRSLYIDNKTFNKSVPCIILTNNFETYQYMCNSNEFYLDLVKFGIDFYIGPPGTAPVRENHVFNSWGVKAKINEYKSKKKQLNNNNYNNLFNINKIFN